MLRTLKDLQGTIGNAEYFHRKDIEPTDNYDEVVIVKELKAEAVKWIRHFNDDLKSAYTKEWIKYFFDLNEEDLKQQLTNSKEEGI